MNLISLKVVRNNDLGLLEFDMRYREKTLCIGFALFRVGFQLFIGANPA